MSNKCCIDAHNKIINCGWFKINKDDVCKICGGIMNNDENEWCLQMVLFGENGEKLRDINVSEDGNLTDRESYFISETQEEIIKEAKRRMLKIKFYISNKSNKKLIAIELFNPKLK